MKLQNKNKVLNVKVLQNIRTLHIGMGIDNLGR